jgi:hypothetical protein
MENRGLLTKILAVTGTALAWFPILAPVYFSLMALNGGRAFFFDYLAPVEYFPAALAAGGLLVWAAQRAHSRLRIIAWGLGIVGGLLVVAVLLAQVNGLVSGRTAAAGFWLVLSLVALVVYTLAVIAMGLGGVLLVRDLFQKKPVSV